MSALAIEDSQMKPTYYSVVDHTIEKPLNFKVPANKFCTEIAIKISLKITVLCFGN